MHRPHRITVLLPIAMAFVFFRTASVFFTMAFVFFAMAFVLAGCSGGSGGHNPGSSPVSVRVTRVVVADAGHALAYSGTIEESETIPLSFPVVGTVSRVLVAEGDAVKKGQSLAELNNASFVNAYEMSLATLKQAEDAYKRLEPMYRNGNLPEVKFIEIQSDLQRARSAATIARKNLDDCVLTSPVNGMVGKRSVEPGMSALPNLASITVVKVEKVFARVSVSENEISSIRRGQKAAITIAALKNARVAGRVEEIGVLADPVAHTYTIRIGIANPDLAIKPGMICSVLIERPDAGRALMVPGEALMVDEAGRTYVYAVDTVHSRAVRTAVRPGALLNAGVEILDGLQATDVVVVAGQHKLTDSAVVRVVGD